MDHTQSEIRRQIESTRSDMAEKISALQGRIDGAVDEMKHLIDPQYQVEHRPWLMVGLSLAAGYLTSRLIFARPKPRTAIVSFPENGSVTSKRVALGRQNSGFIGGLVSTVAMALARDFATTLLAKRASHRRGNSQQPAQTPSPTRLP
jgi:hypothetical protein